MKSRRQGLLEILAVLPLLAIGLLFFVGSIRLDSGALNQMGPGWFPFLLSTTLLILVFVQMSRLRRNQAEVGPGGSLYIGSALSAFAVFIIFSFFGWVAIGAILALALMFATINRKKVIEKTAILLVISLIMLLVHPFLPQ